MKKIAVVGGGATGHTVATVFSMWGHEIHLCDSEAYADVLNRTAALDEIKIEGSLGDGAGKINMVTTDVGKALADVELVVCCTIANRDRETAEMIAPYLKKDSVVLLSAGGMGSFIYRKVFDEKGLTGVVVGESCGNLFPCRLVAPDRIRIGLPLMKKNVAAFPYSDTPKLIEAFEGVYEFGAAGSILECALNGPNLIGHIVLTILNAGAIENATDTYYVFKQGVGRSAMNLADAMFAEKKQVMDALSLPAGVSPSGSYKKYLDPENHDYDNFKNLAGPDSVTNRYITEDTPTLVCLFISVANALGIEVPFFKAMERVASAVNQADYYAEGRTLENLGLGHLKSAEEIMNYFTTQR
jgi:opine dehydrogenase